MAGRAPAHCCRSSPASRCLPASSSSSGGWAADRVASLLGTKLAAIGGFALLAAGLILGAATSVNSGAWFVATWMAIVGAGMGLALATTASAALAELSEDQSGVGSAVLQAVNKTGGPFGAAILGSVLLTPYPSRRPTLSRPHDLSATG